MRSVSVLAYRAKGGAALRRAKLNCDVSCRDCALQRCGSCPSLHPSPDRTDLDLKLELPKHTVAATELIDRETCHEDAPRNVSRDAPSDVPGD
eukprot:5917395-Pyramimonas_sp.AAC.1